MMLSNFSCEQTSMMYSHCNEAFQVITIQTAADPGEGRGGGGGGGAPPLTLNWGPKEGKIFLETGPAPYLRVWMTPPPPPPYLKVWIRHCQEHVTFAEYVIFFTCSFLEVKHYPIKWQEYWGLFMSHLDRNKLTLAICFLLNVLGRRNKLERK